MNAFIHSFNPKSYHINIHIIIDPHTHVLVILNIAHNIHFINQVNVSAHGISYAGAMWITISTLGFKVNTRTDMTKSTLLGASPPKV